MNIGIRYFTKSKKGNTYKLASFISNKLGIEALTTDNDINDELDVLFLVNAMYAADIDDNVKEFLGRNKDKIKLIINVNSSATGRSTLKQVKKECDNLGIKVSEDEFHTKASWLFINRGRPNEDDFNKLNQFIDKVIVK